LSNGVIELDNGNEYELGYNTSFTKFNMLLLDSPLHDPDYLEQRIKPGSYVEINYSPYTFNNSLKRALIVSQP
jgi:hypothetical protein